MKRKALMNADELLEILVDDEDAVSILLKYKHEYNCADRCWMIFIKIGLNLFAIGQLYYLLCVNNKVSEDFYSILFICLALVMSNIHLSNIINPSATETEIKYINACLFDKKEIVSYPIVKKGNGYVIYNNDNNLMALELSNKEIETSEKVIFYSFKKWDGNFMMSLQNEIIYKECA